MALRWWIAILLFLSTTINYISRQTLSQAAPVITRDFHLSNTQYSNITTAFMIAYAIMPIIAGWLLDRLGTKLVLSLAVLWWSIVGMLHATARGVRSFIALRFLLGIGEGPNWPGATKAVAEWFPPSERSLAVGIFDSGSSVGAIIAAPLVTVIVLRYGWRTAFVLTGGLGFIWLALWLKFYYPWQTHPRLSAGERALIVESHQDETPTTRRVPWLRLLGFKQVWAIMIGRVCTDSVWWFYVFWLPQYLSHERGFSLKMIGVLSWIPYVFADLGNLGGGGTATWLAKHGFGLTRARKRVLLVSGVLMVAAAPAALLPSNTLSFSFICAWTFFYAAFITILLALPSDLFESQVVGSVAGLTQTAAAASGALFQILTGFVLDHFHSYTPIFMLAGGLPLIGMIVVLTLIPRVEILRLEPR